MQDYNQAWAYVSAIAGDPNTAVIDWRALHDTDKSDPGHPRRGTLPEWWQWLVNMNDQGYGIFAIVSATDGSGRKLENIAYCRANYIDGDGPDAQQQLERMAGTQPAPAFYVNSSPNKFHTYWTVQPYTGNDRFATMQRKLLQTFNGDPKVADATRVMRVPGFMHRKGTPYPVTLGALPGWGQYAPIEALEAAYAGVQVIDSGHGKRHPLGDPELAAPSLDWIRFGLALVDPNSLDRAGWISMLAAVKQAGWTHGPDAVRALFDEWCARYENNDPGENEKQWNDIRETQLGWNSLLARIPGLRARITFGGEQRSAPAAHLGQPVPAPMVDGAIPPMPEPPALDCSGEILTHLEQQEWFKGCVYVSTFGKILTPKNRFLGVTQFNAEYGGKAFIHNGQSKTTNEAWAAATRSTLWTIPRVDHVRFLPDQPYHAIVKDVLDRDGINLYRPIAPTRATGDVSPFLNHIAAILPDKGDQQILIEYLAHNVKYPGYKIPWMPVIQSAEGVGKGIIKALVTHMMGLPYCYFPNAAELTNSGSQFNAWMRYKLFILVDEIKVDDRQDLIEVLKPMISEKLIEVQGKGVDQELEDNYANWMAFTNWKTAVPVSKNGRRFATFFSALQTAQDLLDRGMNDAYFDALYKWIAGEAGYPHGAAIVTDWLLNYPIERGGIAMRAPLTTSTVEAVKLSRSPVERAIGDAIEDGLQGFRGGWVSSIAAQKRIRETGAVRGTVAPHVIHTILEGLGYVAVGRAPSAYLQEDPASRAELYHLGGWADPSAYKSAQGYN